MQRKARTATIASVECVLDNSLKASRRSVDGGLKMFRSSRYAAKGNCELSLTAARRASRIILGRNMLKNVK